MAAPWTTNRVLIALAGFFMLVSMFVFTGGDMSKAVEFAPSFPGLLATIALLFFAPAWLYLTAGILLAVLPLMVLFVFRAISGLGEPAGGPEYQALLLLLAALILGLTGGIAGFVQTRRGNAAPARELLRTRHGLASVVVVAIFLGMFVTSGLASAQLRTAVTDSSATNIEPDVTVNVLAKDFVFAPAEVTVPVDQIVALVVTNKDTAAHTFTYDNAGESIDALVPASGSTTILLRFDAPQTITFWCAPHSDGAQDDGTGMVGKLIVR